MRFFQVHQHVKLERIIGELGLVHRHQDQLKSVSTQDDCLNQRTGWLDRQVELLRVASGAQVPPKGQKLNMKVRVAKLAQVPPKRKKLKDLQLVLVQELWQEEKGEKEEDERVVDVVGK